MRKKQILTGYRILFGLVGFSALVTEVATIVERGRFVPVNFFSYFTIESNIFALTILILSALALAQGKESNRLAMLRGASTVYMVTVIIVFDLLLSNIEGASLTAIPWDNTVLHYIIPVAVLVDWLSDIPRTPIVFRRALIWLLFPLAYVAYSLIRGHFVGWYPYPFLNPTEQGYVLVAVITIAIGLGATALIWLVSWVTRIKKVKSKLI